MPSYTRNIKRDTLVFVPCNTKILYGFKRKDIAAIAGISSSDITPLGHLAPSAAAAQSGKIMVIAASAPKPPKVRRNIANASAGTQQSVSTFCGKSNLAAALAAGWSLAKPGLTVTLRAPSAESGSLSVIATLSNGAKYVFSLNKADFDAYGAALGLESSIAITTDTERDSLVRGSSNPKPGKASIKLTGRADLSTFYSTGANLSQAGFNLLSEEIILASASSEP